MGAFFIKLACWLLDLTIWWAAIFALMIFQYRWFEKAKTEKVKDCLDSTMHITIYVIAPVVIVALSVLYFFFGICIPFPL